MSSELVKLYMVNHYKPLSGSMSDYYKKLDLYTLDGPTVRLLMYIITSLKSKRNDYLNSQLIELRPEMFTISRNGFFKSIKELIDLNIISKTKPHVFMVNPGYHCSMNDEQRKRFNFDLEEELLDRSFSSFG